MRNPFRSEADAFRLLLRVGGAVLLIAAAFVVGGTLIGLPLAVIFGAIAARATYGWIRAGLSAPDGEDGHPDA